jgi:hypothetical protein
MKGNQSLRLWRASRPDCVVTLERLSASQGLGVKVRSARMGNTKAAALGCGDWNVDRSRSRCYGERA